MVRTTLIFIAAVLMISLASGQSICSAPTAACRQFKEYVSSLQSSPSDDALREKIISLSLELNPPASTPPDAAEHEGAAEFFFKNAKNEQDYARAAQEYEKALLAAPWVSSDYYNLGVSWEKAAESAKAISAFQLYLRAAPDANDANDVRKRIGGLKAAIQTAEEQPQRVLPSAQIQTHQIRPADLSGEWWSGHPLKNNTSLFDCSAYQHYRFVAQSDELTLIVVNDWDYEASNGPPKHGRWFRVGEEFPDRGRIKLLENSAVVGTEYFDSSNHTRYFNLQGSVIDHANSIKYSWVRQDGVSGEGFYVRKKLCGTITP